MAGIDQDLLQQVLKTSLARGGDFADVFIEDTLTTGITLDSTRIRSINSGIVSGAGIRVITGSDYVYLYAGDPDADRLMALAEEAADAVAAGASGACASLERTTFRNRHTVKQLPGRSSLDDKVALLLRADAAARAYSPKITEAMVTYGDREQQVIIAASDGTFARDRRVRTRMTVTCIASDGEKSERGFFGPGKSQGLELFAIHTPESIAEEAARIACTLLDADYAPQGTMPVIIANEFGGVIFHEACGHALEATSVAKNASIFSGRLRKRIASTAVTAYDDPTIRNEWGSANIDDEGMRTKKIKLIQRGRLVSYLVDRLGSIRMDHPPTASGRRESYMFAPTSRMSNTYIHPGKHTFDEMVSAIDDGLYCKRMGGGSVNPSTTEFNFSVMEAYRIRGGTLGDPVKGASLIGTGEQVLKHIDMVGNDLGFGAGMCGSLSGSIPASVGQPSIMVSGLVVGGRS